MKLTGSWRISNDSAWWSNHWRTVQRLLCKWTCRTLLLGKLSYSMNSTIVIILVRIGHGAQSECSSVYSKFIALCTIHAIKVFIWFTIKFNSIIWWISSYVLGYWIIHKMQRTSISCLYFLLWSPIALN